MYDPVTGEWETAYDGSDGYAGVTKQIFKNLAKGMEYKFKIAAAY